MDGELAKRIVRTAQFPLVDRIAKDIMERSRSAAGGTDAAGPSPTADNAESAEGAWKPILKQAGPSLLSPYEQLDAVLRQLVIEHEKLLAPVVSIVGPSHTRMPRQLGEHGRSADSCPAHRPHWSGSDKRSCRASPGPTLRACGFTDVTARAPEPIRSRLAGVAKSLREVLNALHQEHIALRVAAETLSMHMEGLLRQVCRRLSHTGTYAAASDSSVQLFRPWMSELGWHGSRRSTHGTHQFARHWTLG